MADLFTLTEQAIAGLNPELELVSVEWGPLSLLRVTIDTPEGICIEHCEEVSRHLSHVYEVENIDYKRLEVGSPGLDRPLKTEKDFHRFAGERVEIKFHQPINQRKVFTGILQEAEADAFELIVQDDPKKEPLVVHFTFPEVAKAKLDPILNFKGKNK